MFQAGPRVSQLNTRILIVILLIKTFRRQLLPIAYFRVNWRFLEPECQKYIWAMIDKALRTAAEHSQTLMLRISPWEAGAEKDTRPVQ
jgi:hypothetical protein